MQKPDKFEIKADIPGECRTLCVGQTTINMLAKQLQWTQTP